MLGEGDRDVRGFISEFSQLLFFVFFFTFLNVRRCDLQRASPVSQRSKFNKCICLLEKLNKICALKNPGSFEVLHDI